jgi:UDP-glucose 4-epimerase
VILRPAHIVGPHVRNAPSKYMRLATIPYLMGYDPMMRLTHEDDLLRYCEGVIEQSCRGVFNLASTAPVPLSHVLEIIGKPTIPVPYTALRWLLEKLWGYGLTSFPAPELDHLRFHAVLDTARAEQTLAVKPERSLYEILEPFRADHAEGDA